jgi:hypothetical protein
VALAVKATVCPTFTVWLATGAKVGGVLVRVRAMVVVWLSDPLVPVIVTVVVPVIVVLDAVSVNTLVPIVGFVPNVAVTPLGRPLALSVKQLFKPLVGVMVIVLVLFDPLFTVRLAGFADRLKSGEGVFQATESM